MDLKEQQVIQLTTDSTALSEEQVKDYIKNLHEWTLDKGDTGYQLNRTFYMPTFDEALLFMIKVGESAKEQKHYPTFCANSTQVEVCWNSSQVDGLHMNDFIMAAKTDDIFSRWAVVSGLRDEVEEASDESFPASDPPGYR